MTPNWLLLCPCPSSSPPPLSGNMAASAAAAAAAVASSFSSPIHTLKTLRSKNDSFLIRIPSTHRTALPSSSAISQYLPLDPLPISALPHKWRVQRIAASVAQEEAEAAGQEVELGDEVAVSADDSAETEEPLNTKLYFGNLPYNIDSAQLAGMIQEYATPEMVEVLYDRETGRSRGFGFATMSSIEDCNAVLDNLDRLEYMGRILRVNFSDKPKPKEPLYPETEHKLFVGNLAWSVTTESLMQAFQEHGNVVGARVLYDGQSGKPRGFGFVSFSTQSEMEAALEALNGVELEGRQLRVSIAQGKKPRD